MQIQFLSYFLGSLAIYLGLLIGVILIKLAPEEQKPGRKYFIIFRKILFFLILIPILFYYNINIIYSSALLLFIVALMFGNKLRLNKSYLVYLLFGIIFFLSSKFSDLFVIVSALIFLYGIPNASLIFNMKKKNYADIFVKNLIFFVPIVVFYFFP
jgi:hypothetical protein